MNRRMAHRLRSGGRPACRRGGRLAPRNPRFKAREQVDLNRGIPMNLPSVAAGVSPAVEGGVSPPGFPGSRPAGRSILNRWLSTNPQCRRSRGLKRAPSPQSSPGGRGSRVLPSATCQNPTRPSHRDSLPPTPNSTLRNSLCMFTLSLRERAGVRAARNHPRARFMVPSPIPIPPIFP